MEVNETIIEKILNDNNFSTLKRKMSSEIFLILFSQKRQDGLCLKLEKVVYTKTHLAPLISVSSQIFYILVKEFY